MLFVLIGWPLLLDVAGSLRFELPPFFQGRSIRTLLVVVAVAATLVDDVVGAGITFFL